MEKTEVKPCIPLKNKRFEGQLSLVGYSENYAEILEKGIAEGKVTYEELQKGNKVILSKTALHWYPELKVGDKIMFQYSDGNVEKEKSLEIAAIGNYSEGIVNYSTFLTAKSAVNAMSQYNVNDALSILQTRTMMQSWKRPWLLPVKRPVVSSLQIPGRRGMKNIKHLCPLCICPAMFSLES